MAPKKHAQEPVKVYVWTDFVCPFCLIAEKSLKQAVSDLNAEIVWMPFELRPYPAATLRPEDDYLTRVWEGSVYPTARRYGVDLRLPTVSPQPYTRKAFIGMQYAAEKGKANEYTEAVLSAFFQHNQDIGDSNVLADIASKLGIDAENFTSALEDSEYAHRYDRQKSLAARIDIKSVPSILIGDKLFSGVTDAETLIRAIRDTEILDPFDNV